MENLILNSENDLIVHVKLFEGKYKGQTIPMRYELNDILMGNGISEKVIDAGLLESMGHPCDSFEIVKIEYCQF